MDFCHFHISILQVLTGELPFHDVQRSALAYTVVHDGKRPEKPENALAIGLSDSLWNFVQQCWDGNLELRPEIGEVVACLEAAAANWNKLLPPYAQVKNISPSTEGTSGSGEYYESDVLTSLTGFGEGGNSLPPTSELALERQSNLKISSELSYGVTFILLPQNILSLFPWHLTNI